MRHVGQKRWQPKMRPEIDTPIFSQVNPRDFVRLCGSTAAILGLGESGVLRVAEVLGKAVPQRPSVVWLNFASDSGCTEALIKASYRKAANLILETLSLDFNETIMAAAGEQAEEVLQGALHRGDYILVMEGAIPTKRGYGMIARREISLLRRPTSASRKAASSSSPEDLTRYLH